MRAYNDLFFTTADRTAALAADGVLRHLNSRIPVKSVLDLGCGRGVWLAQWVAYGAKDVIGVDGPYVDLNKIQIPKERFLASDLTKPLELNRQFDLVQSLEVAEHLDPAAGDQFVDNITRHGKLVLFSAAIPGQGGEYHINERPWSYWHEKFVSRGYEVFDFLRPRIKKDRSIFFWYRHNTFIYAHKSIIDSLPEEIRATHVRPGHLRNYLPVWAKVRVAAIRCLPRFAVDAIARAKYKVLSLRPVAKMLGPRGT